MPSTDRKRQKKAARKRSGGSSRTPRLVVGWRELVALPAWGIERLQAKVDTGARTSAIHAEHIVSAAPGRVRFRIITDRHDHRDYVTVEAKVVRHSRVKPSSGKVQHRYVVEAPIRIGDFSRTIEISLVSRENMVCRMLVGRTALAGHILVDSGRSWLLGPRPEPESRPEKRSKPESERSTVARKRRNEEERTR